MARATIPYNKLEKLLFKAYPYPTFTNVVLYRTRRDYNYGPSVTPRTIYDRSEGKFNKVGYRCIIGYDMFVGIDKDLLPKYKSFKHPRIFEI